MHVSRGAPITVPDDTRENCKRLSVRARELLADVDNECRVSSASAWEIAISVRLARHSLGWPLARIEDVIDEPGIRSLPLTLRHAAALEQVGTSHGDPFDRLLLAHGVGCITLNSFIPTGSLRRTGACKALREIALTCSSSARNMREVHLESEDALRSARGECS